MPHLFLVRSGARFMQCSVITGPVFALHDCPGHPESAHRIHAILDDLPADTPILSPVAASPDDLYRVHEKGYLKWLQSFSPLDPEAGLKSPVTFEPWFIDPDTYITPWSYGVATYAAGAACQAAQLALDNKSSIALVRPPGHHALPSWAMGFCLINNIAVAAAQALESVDKIAIIDWDVHHGNGTQEIFKKTLRVLYCSVHAEGIFPRSGAPNEIGTGKGMGYTVNAPLTFGCGIGDYVCVFRDLFVPVLERYQPDLLLVSAGQDAQANDPLSVMALNADDYGILTRILIESTGLSPAFILEGGYGRSHPAAINAILSAIEGFQPEEPVPPPSEATLERVHFYRKLHHLSGIP